MVVLTLKKAQEDKTNEALGKDTVLKSITVKRFDQQHIKLNSLSKKHHIILKVLGRLRCPITRYECKLLSRNKPLFDMIGVRLVAITHEVDECQNFIHEGYWEGDMLIDENKKIYDALGIVCQSEIDGLSDLFSKNGVIAKNAAKAAHINGDFDEELFQLGGTFVVKKGGRLVYEFRQDSISQFPSIKEIYSIIGGNPDIIEEIVPMECVHHGEIHDTNENSWTINPKRLSTMFKKLKK